VAKRKKRMEVDKMVGKIAKNKTTAKRRAMMARKKGFEASVFKKKKGYGVSITRK